jgi:hypothetical protein
MVGPLLGTRELAGTRPVLKLPSSMQLSDDRTGRAPSSECNPEDPGRYRSTLWQMLRGWRTLLDMDEPETWERGDRALSEQPIRAGRPRWRGTIAAVLAVLAVVAVPVVITRLLTPEEPGWSSDGITLNTSSSEPSDSAVESLIVSVVGLDVDGCVYLRSPGSLRNVVWPDGYTASRQSDGRVTILNQDGVAVAAVGYRLRASGVEAPSDTDLACTVDGFSPPTLMIQDELPPLSE